MFWLDTNFTVKLSDYGGERLRGLDSNSEGQAEVLMRSKIMEKKKIYRKKKILYG